MMFPLVCLLVFQIAVTIGDKDVLLETLYKDVREMKAEIRSLKSQLAFHQKRDLPAVRTQVAFSTRLSHQTSGVGHGQAIVYDKELTDTHNAYNNGDGIFTVPVTGMYVFTWSISVSGGRYLSSELRKNGVAYGFSYIDSESRYDFGDAANIVVIKANAGDHVNVVTGTNGDGVIEGANGDTFSGWLLFESE